MALLSSNYHRKLVSSLYTLTRTCSQLAKSVDKGTSTVDQNEVDFHSKLSNLWWEENGSLKGLHALNKIRIQLIRSGLINEGVLSDAETHHNPLYLKGLKIADIGCGGGILSMNLARLGCNVVGIEPSQELVNVAKEAAERFKLTGETQFVATSIEEYAKENSENVDAIVCSEVIEHVTQKDIFLEACAKILKPGGSLFFTTPNRTAIGNLLTIYAAEYIFRVLPKGTHHYEKFITPEELSQLLINCSCETKMVNGFIYSPLNNTFYWTPTTSVLYALHAVKWK